MEPLLIAIDAIHSNMLNDDIISGQTNMSGDVDDSDELLISDGGTLKRIDFSVLRDAVFNDVSGDATIVLGLYLYLVILLYQGHLQHPRLI